MTKAKKEADTVLNRIDRSIGGILGIIRCLQILSEIENFHRWLKSYNQAVDAELFDGYKFTIETLIRMLHSEIERNESLQLTKDDLFLRASFAGVSFYKLPNSCEKSIILRNISYNAEPIPQATEWSSLKEALAKFQREALTPLASLANKAVVPSKHQNIDMDDAIKYSAMFQIYIYLNDTSRGIPHGYREPVFKRDGSPSFIIRKRIRERFRYGFVGYKYSVLFLWTYLLGERFNNTSLISLHKSRDWQDFDNFFEKIREEIILPLEDEIKAKSGFDCLVILKEPIQNVLGDIISIGPPESRLTKKDSLDRFFLWYEIELLDGSNFDFAGVASFIPMLMGLVEIGRSLRKRDKEYTVRVIRLIHGSQLADRRDYSYAVLVQVGGIFTDSSGWILFYDCCSDAGSTSLLYEEAENRIRMYERKGLISVAEQRVDKKLFLKLMKHRLLSLTQEQMYYLLKEHNL